MNISADKFLALTAMLAGFVPATGCTIIDNTTGSASDTNTPSTDPNTTGTSDDPTSGSTGDSAGTTGGGDTTTGDTTIDIPTTGSEDTTGSDSTTTLDTTTTTTEGTTGGVESECCVVQETPGCGDETVEMCVCAEDPFCCGEEDGIWDDVCVALVNSLECGIVCEIEDPTDE